MSDIDDKLLKEGFYSVTITIVRHNYHRSAVLTCAFISDSVTSTFYKDVLSYRGRLRHQRPCPVFRKRSLLKSSAKLSQRKSSILLAVLRPISTAQLVFYKSSAFFNTLGLRLRQS